MRKILLAAILMAGMASSSFSQDAQQPGGRRGGARGGAPAAATPAPAETPASGRGGANANTDEPKEETVTTTHTMTINGQEIRYTATAGTLVLKRDAGGKTEPLASVFYIAYTKLGESDKSKRPIMYAFNGGPGSSSVWMHLGLLGPKRVKLDKEGMPSPPPYSLIDNDYSILPATDLVFIDPVSTGYSREAPGQNANQFHGLQEDLQSVGEFIRLYTTRNARWSSPKFVAGESYGTTRAAGLAGYLQGTEGMNLNGIILVSSILNWANSGGSPGNDLPYELNLPTFASVAWFHKKMAPEFQALSCADAVKKAEEFADGPYAAALRKGDLLTAAERKDMAAQTAKYIGLTPQLIEDSNLRVGLSRFQKNLLHDEKLTVGRYDGRYTGMDREVAGNAAEFDPSDSAVNGVFTGAFNTYIREELNFKKDIPYEILTGVRPWPYGQDNGYANLAETLRSAISQNPFLKVFSANGYFDQATPQYATVYTLNHMQLDPRLHDNVKFGFYESGHMIYLRESELVKLHADLDKFVKDSVAK